MVLAVIHSVVHDLLLAVDSAKAARSDAIAAAVSVTAAAKALTSYRQKWDAPILQNLVLLIALVTFSIFPA